MAEQQLSINVEQIMFQFVEEVDLPGRGVPASPEDGDPHIAPRKLNLSYDCRRSVY